MSNDLLELLFQKNQKRIDEVNDRIDEQNENDFVSQFTYGFIACTLAEAQAFGAKPRQIRFITNARKSGEGVGAGTGLPAFYDATDAAWVDFMGNAIVV